MMSLRHLEMFHALMTASSMTEAARRLNVTQPAVSVMLKHAETQLGMTLFKRTNGRLRPTPEAEALFPEAENIFRRLGVLNRLASDLRLGRIGSLAIAATPTLAIALIPRVIAKFQKIYPDVELTLDAVATPEVANRVALREVDVGLVYALTMYHGTDAETIGRSRICCVIPRNHPLSARERITPADLQGTTIITYRSSHPFGRLIDEAISASGVISNIKIRINQTRTSCLLANESGSVALVDRISLARDDIPGMVVKNFEPLIESDITLLFPSNHVQSLPTQAFAQLMRDVIGDDYSLPGA